MSHDVSTPQWLFNACNELAILACGSHITLDACAADWNAKCKRFFTAEDDALIQKWNRHKAVFCNPPWERSRLGLFVRKALEESRKGTTVVLILPHWDYSWFDLCEKHGRIHRVVGPVNFGEKDGQEVVLNCEWHSARLMVVVFSPTVKSSLGAPIRKGEIVMSEITKLNQKETALKKRLEGIVDKWLEQALDAGKALLEIKSAKLYRETHSSFEEYVKERFAKTRQWAYDFIKWYEVNHLAETLDKPLSNRATRPLQSVTKNSPEKVKKIVTESKKIAKKDGRKDPTEEDVSAAKLKILPMIQPRKAPARPQKAFEVTIYAVKDNEMEVLKVLDEMKAKYTKPRNRKGEVTAIMESVSAFMLHLGKAFDKAETFDISITGKKVEISKKCKSA